MTTTKRARRKQYITRRWLGDRLNAHVINENRDYAENDPRSARSALWYGRAFFRWYPDPAHDEDHSIDLGHIEWHLTGRRLSAGITFNDDEHPLIAHVGCFGVFYLCLGPWARRVWPLSRLHARYRYDARTLDFYVADGIARLNLWIDPHSWSRREKKWRRLSIEPMQLLFGEMAYSTLPIETREHVPIAVGEHEPIYHARARLEQATWRRARWPFSFGPHWLLRSLRRVTLDIDEKSGIPHPGKGENAWDCGDDATFGITTAARTIEEGIGHLVASVLDSRHRHGGADWRPRVARADEEEEGTTR